MPGDCCGDNSEEVENPYAYDEKDEVDKPTKEEYAVAKYLRFALPDRDGKLHGMEVKCFMGNAAVDKLMDSKWSATQNKNDAIFTNRASCVNYMVRLLEKGLFHRAEKEKRKKDKEKENKTKKKKTDKDAEKEDSANPAEELKERKGKKVKKTRKEREAEAAKTEEIEKKEAEEKKDTKEEKKKLKLLKLVMPEKQFFEDGSEVFVWIYDPVNAKTFLIGLLMVLGAISLCMFPLWPEEVRIGVYYLSLAAASFVGFILVLVVVRLILFCCIWVLTFGTHHFWLLPNLTEDVGFFDSFKPLYFHEKVNRGGSEEPKPEDENTKKNKKEDSKDKSKEKDDSDEFEVIKKEDYDDSDKAQDGDEEVNDDNEDVENDNDVGEEEEDDEESNINDNGDSEEDTEPKKTK